MLSIKLKRIGKKHQATFRVIVAERRSKVDGSFIEDLGFWNPHSNELSLNAESAKKWIENGAQPTDSVHNLFVKSRIIDEPKKSVHIKPKKAEKA